MLRLFHDCQQVTDYLLDVFDCKSNVLFATRYLSQNECLNTSYSS